MRSCEAIGSTRDVVQIIANHTYSKTNILLGRYRTLSHHKRCYEIVRYTFSLINASGSMDPRYQYHHHHHRLHSFIPETQTSCAAAFALQRLTMSATQHPPSHQSIVPSIAMSSSSNTPSPMTQSPSFVLYYNNNDYTPCVV